MTRPAWRRRWDATAEVSYASTPSCCSWHVSTIVNRRSTARSPSSLRLPNMTFRHCTEVLRPRSAASLVAATPFCVRRTRRRGCARPRSPRGETAPQGEQPLLDRDHFLYELRASQGRLAHADFTSEPRPQAKRRRSNDGGFEVLVEFCCLSAS